MMVSAQMQQLVSVGRLVYESWVKLRGEAFFQSKSEDRNMSFEMLPLFLISKSMALIFLSRHCHEFLFTLL